MNPDLAALNAPAQQLPGEPAGAAPEPTAADRFAARRVSYGYLQRDLNAIPAAWRLVAVAIDGGAGVIVLERNPQDPALLRANFERLEQRWVAAQHEAAAAVCADVAKALRGELGTGAHERVAWEVQHLLQERERIAVEVVGTCTELGVAMLEMNPCGPGEVAAAIRRVAVEARKEAAEKWLAAEHEVEREHEVAVRAAQALAEAKRALEHAAAAVSGGSA